MSEVSPVQEGGEPPAEPAGQEAPPIDVQALAERVYRLMLAEARRERARGETTRRPGRR